MVSDKDLVAGQEGEKLLLDESRFPIVGIVNVELLAPGEDLPLHPVAIPAHFILHGELVAPGKYLLSDI